LIFYRFLISSGVAYKQYRYWDQSGRKLDIDGMLEDIRNAPNNSIILLHACAHNPTGVDPSQDEWKRIASVIREKNHLPFFDSAYQGFASGDLERDAWAVRYFIDQGFELFVAQSFAKNFGLYNERVGTLSVVTKSKDVAKALLSQLKLVARPSYSNPPAHGARIVSTVLNDKGLTSEWHDELRGMSGRIQKMRDALRGELERLGTPGTWRHITDQIGMFSYTGLTKEQCKYLTEKHHIYLLTNGRISMAGINSNNVKYVAKAIDDAVKNIKN
jgi:aspartate aminotransferase, cytoplasmic